MNMRKQNCSLNRNPNSCNWNSCRKSRSQGKRRHRNSRGIARAGGGNSADADFESTWFAARNKQRTGAREERASLADIVTLMKIQKSEAAKKHLDDRVGLWSRRYSYREPQGFVIRVPEFNNEKSGGSGGVGVVKDFTLQIHNEFDKA